MTGRVLTRLGFEVTQSTEGEEAIAFYQEAMDSSDPFRLVILDLTIPGGPGGAEVLARLLKIDPGVKAVVSSGYSIDAEMAHYRELGFVGVLPKPYTVQQMTELLSRLLG